MNQPSSLRPSLKPPSSTGSRAILAVHGVRPKEHLDLCAPDPYYAWRQFKSGCVQVLTLLCALVVLTPLVLILFQLMRAGLAAFNWNFFAHLPKPGVEAGGGMANAIVGTFLLLSLSAIFGVPVGVMGGVYLAEYGQSKTAAWVRFGANILNGVPSITWGLAVYGLVVLPMQSFSALAGGLVLGFMMIPMVMRTTEEVVALVPGSYREAALALGIPRWRVTLQVVMRTAIKGITAGVLLASARMAGETAPLLFTAFGNRFWSHQLTDPIAVLPLQIFRYAISPYDDWHRQAWAGALLLLILVGGINAAVWSLTRDRLS